MPLVSSFLRFPGRWRRRPSRRNRMALQIALLAIVLLVVLPIYTIYKPPKYLISRLQERFPDVLFHVPTTRRVVALTIDDAPSGYTAQILRILRANNATATFFAIGGQVPGREDLLQEILKSGSELGNHAMHDEPSINLPSSTFRNEINEVNGLIDTAYATFGRNRTAHYFRPGSGIFSRRLLDIAREESYRTILGSIYPHDPFLPYWRVNAWHVLSMLRPGAIIICHDRRAWTVPMLQRVVPEMRRRGYDVVSVSELLEITGAS